jgi:hypothetical protein
MTVREQFRRRRVRIMSLIGGGIACFMLIAALRQGNSHLMPFAVLAFVVVVITMISFGRFRCPKCHAVLSAVNLPQDGFLSFPRYCPSCGCDFEALHVGDAHI